MKIIELNTLKEVEKFTEHFLEILAQEANSNQATVVALTGDLGAGKTTFVQNLAKALGVAEVVQSPTFTIFKVYETTHPIFHSLVHMDAYRLESLSELAPLHFSEILEKPNTLVCIEWAEKIKPAIPDRSFSLTFDHQNLETRKVTVDDIFA